MTHITRRLRHFIITAIAATTLLSGFAVFGFSGPASAATVLTISDPVSTFVPSTSTSPQPGADIYLTVPTASTGVTGDKLVLNVLDEASTAGSFGFAVAPTLNVPNFGAGSTTPTWWRRR